MPRIKKSIQKEKTKDRSNRISIEYSIGIIGCLLTFLYPGIWFSIIMSTIILGFIYFGIQKSNKTYITQYELQGTILHLTYMLNNEKHEISGPIKDYYIEIGANIWSGFRGFGNVLTIELNETKITQYTAGYWNRYTMKVFEELYHNNLK